MINCVVIQNNNITEIKVKNLTEASIYKKCNFKNNTDFSKIKDWQYKDFTIELWGKTKGISNSLSDFVFYKKYAIHIYGKSIFLMKDTEGKYISIAKEVFLDFFKITECEEPNVIIETIGETKETNLDEHAKSVSEYSYNPELTYELYEYSDEESID
tara:strand:+ start:452 stop:922 length:471 start_codon:yes stop_codon:yes gene_type:complete